MTAPPFQILTQKELVIDLSVPAMHILVDMLLQPDWRRTIETCGCDGELDNFRNLLQNLLERSETGNLDLIGG